MQRRSISALVHSCLCAFLLVVPLRGEIIDRVLAVVNGSLITLSDVNAASELGLVMPAADADPVRAVLLRLIDRELQLSEVDRYAPPEPSPAEIDREMDAVASRFPSRALFDAALARSGVEPATLRDTLREDLRIRAYLDQRFSTSGERQQQVEEWLAGLRRRSDVIDLSLAGR